MNKGKEGVRRTTSSSAKDPETEKEIRPPVSILIRRPVALLSVVPTPAVWFVAGAFAGAVGKTIVAPLERVKMLLQVKGGLQTGAVRAAAARGGILRSLTAIAKTEGVVGFWKGNLPQVLRIVPYCAVQLGSYEALKRFLRKTNKELPVWRRITAGACAGILATTVTYPLDTLRFRLAVDPSVSNLQQAIIVLFKESGFQSFYRGLKPAIVGIAPYMAIELSSFDLLPQEIPSFVRGLLAALFATSCCYPIDTVRRRVQLASSQKTSARNTLIEMVQEDGLGTLYRGFLPNAVKNLPNKGIRYSTFEAVKKLLVLSQSAYAEQCMLYSKQLHLQRITYKT